jgi:Na+-driven multidrug efflux pump
MLGNMIFKKRKTGKTFAWILLILFVLTLIIQIPFIEDFIVYIGEHIKSPEAAYWFGIAILLVITTCLNLLTYRRIKNQKY